MKALLRILLKLFFGFRTYGEAALRADGPVLLVPNHVSWFDDIVDRWFQIVGQPECPRHLLQNARRGWTRLPAQRRRGSGRVVPRETMAIRAAAERRDHAR